MAGEESAVGAAGAAGAAADAATGACGAASGACAAAGAGGVAAWPQIFVEPIADSNRNAKLTLFIFLTIPSQEYVFDTKQGAGLQTGY